VCLARRHRWVTTRDVAGPVTTRSRSDFEPLSSHGPEELDAEQP
jgi:hypothetical protein